MINGRYRFAFGCAIVISFMSLTLEESAKILGPKAHAEPVPDCPKCHTDARVQLIRAMRRHSLNEDWFRCDKCDHLFARPR